MKHRPQFEGVKNQVGHMKDPRTFGIVDGVTLGGWLHRRLPGPLNEQAQRIASTEEWYAMAFDADANCLSITAGILGRRLYT